MGIKITKSHSHVTPQYGETKAYTYFGVSDDGRLYLIQDDEQGRTATQHDIGQANLRNVINMISALTNLSQHIK